MKEQKWWAYFFLLLSIFGWAGNVIFGRYLHDILPPFGLGFWRWALALIFLTLWRWRHILKFLKLLKTYFFQFFLLAIFGVVVAGTFQYVALDYTSATDVGIMISLMPIFIAFFAEIILKEKTSFLQKMGILLAFVGTLVLISEGRIHNIFHFNFNFGDLISFIAALSWGVYTALLRKFNLPCDTWEIVQGIGVVGLLIITLILFAGGADDVHRTFLAPELLTPSVLSGLLFVSLVASLFSYWGWNYGVQVVGAANAGVFLYLVPLFSAVLAVTFLNEHLHLYHILGAITILVGVYLTKMKT